MSSEVEASKDAETTEICGDAFSGSSVAQAGGLSMVAQRLFRQPLDPIQLSRYILLEPLGQGAFGAVYAAYDPELHRKVAIKLLAPRHGSAHNQAETRARFLREAQAMAHFTHANVVQIHDVGTYALDDALHDDIAAVVREGVFLVMELVDGQRFDHWAQARRRDWQEVVRPMLEAAHGLAAAHGAGLVHRDFKPANVLVDTAGHPKILDFGLARMRGEASSSEGFSAVDSELSFPDGDGISSVESRDSVDAPGPLGDAITRTGTVLGTPRYMSPEQLLGREAHAHSDQYAYCVTLYELLFGGPPFVGRRVDDLTKAKLAVTGLRPPPGSKVPAWVFRVIKRGLAVEPDDRFADMNALIVALARDPARRRRRVAMGGAALAVTVAVSVLAARQGEPVSPCDTHRSELDGVWDEPVRNQVEQAFMRSAAPHVDKSWAAVSEALDGWSARWVHERVAVCEAGRRPDAPSSEEQAHRLVCLERHRRRAAGLTRVLGSADAEVVAAAGLMADALESPDACTKPSRVDASTGHGDLAEQEHGEEAVAEARALLTLHATSAAVEVAREAVEAAENSGVVHLEARAGTVLAQALLRDTQPEQARDVVQVAIAAAERAGDDELACEGMVVLLRTLAELGDYDGAELVGRLARARAESAGVGDRVAALLAYQQGVVRVRQGRYALAQPHLEDARRLRQRLYGAEHPLVAVVDNALGVALFRDGRRDEAHVALSRARTTFEAALGPEHPELSKVHNNLGNYWRVVGRYDAAYRELEHAAAINAVNYPPEHPSHASMQYNLSLVASDQGRRAEALEHMARAERLRRDRLGDDHPDVMGIEAERASLLRQMGRTEQAGQVLQGVLVRQTAMLGEGHRDRLQTAMALASVQMDLGQAEAGRALALDTIRLAETHMPGSTSLGRWLVIAGRIDLRTGHLAEAERASMRALELLRYDSGERSVQLTQAYMLQGDIALKRGDTGRAQEVLTRALDLMVTLFGETHGRLAWPLQRRAVARIRAGDRLGARSDLERALRLVDDYEGPLMQRAEVRMDLLPLLPNANSERAARLAAEIQAKIDDVRAQDFPDDQTGADELERDLDAWRKARTGTPSSAPG